MKTALSVFGCFFLTAGLIAITEGDCPPTYTATSPDGSTTYTCTNTTNTICPFDGFIFNDVEVSGKEVCATDCQVPDPVTDFSGSMVGLIYGCDYIGTVSGSTTVENHLIIDSGAELTVDGGTLDLDIDAELGVLGTLRVTSSGVIEAVNTGAQVWVGGGGELFLQNSDTSGSPGTFVVQGTSSAVARMTIESSDIGAAAGNTLVDLRDHSELLLDGGNQISCDAAHNVDIEVGPGATLQLEGDTYLVGDCNLRVAAGGQVLKLKHRNNSQNLRSLKVLDVQGLMQWFSVMSDASSEQSITVEDIAPGSGGHWDLGNYNNVKLDVTNSGFLTSPVFQSNGTTIGTGTWRAVDPVIEVASLATNDPETGFLFPDALTGVNVPPFRPAGFEAPNNASSAFTFRIDLSLTATDELLFDSVQFLTPLEDDDTYHVELFLHPALDVVYPEATLYRGEILVDTVGTMAVTWECNSLVCQRTSMTYEMKFESSRSAWIVELSFEAGSSPDDVPQMTDGEDDEGEGLSPFVLAGVGAVLLGAIVGAVFIVRGRVESRSGVVTKASREAGFEGTGAAALLARKADAKSANAFSKSDFKDKLTPFQRLLMDSPTFAYVLGDVVDQDRRATLGRALCRVFESQKRGHALIENLSAGHVSSGDIGNAADAFRASSFPSSVVGLYLRLVGEDYLAKMLGPIVKSAMSSSKPTELDPRLATASVDKGVSNVTKLATKVANAIVKTPVPLQIQDALAHVRSALVGKGWSERAGPVISQMFLSRFVLPALSLPHTYGLSEKAPPPETLRALVLTSKAVSGLTGFATLGGKEDFMASMEDWRQKHAPAMRKFIAGLGSKKPTPSHAPAKVSVYTDDTVRKAALLTVYDMALEKGAGLTRRLDEDTAQSWSKLSGTADRSWARSTLTSVGDLRSMQDLKSDKKWADFNPEKDWKALMAKIKEGDAVGGGGRPKSKSRARKGSQSRPKK